MFSSNNMELNKDHYIPLFITNVFAVLLGNQYNVSPIATLIMLSALFYYSYFIHRLAHLLPPPFDIHMTYHHSNAAGTASLPSRIINFVIETLTDCAFFGMIYLVQVWLNIHIMPTFLLFYYGFIYVTIHMINYSLLHVSPEHIQHHTSCNGRSNCTPVNYGPDLVDHIFNTNLHSSYENYNHIIPNTLAAYFLTATLF